MALDEEAGAVSSAYRLELRLRVEAANEAAAAWRASEARLLRLLDGLGDVSGDDVDAVMTDLRSILHGRRSLPLPLEKRASQVLARARANADKQYAADVLVTELEAMGYDVGPTFAVELASNQTTMAARSDWGPYAVRIRFDHPDGVNLHVVRDDARPASSAENQRIRDREVEAAWCGDLGVIEQRMRGKGVALDLTRRTAAGLRPVLAVSGVESDVAARRHAGKKSMDRRR